MSTAGLTLRQVRFTNKSFWRNPASAFFTFAFPLMFLVIFTSLLGSGDAKVNGVVINQATYYVVTMASFGVISATFTNIAISVTFQREAGILKRTRGTPLPGGAYLSGRVTHAMLVSFVLVAITMLFGVAFYSAGVPSGIGLVEFLITLVVGGLSFSALALALTSIVPNAEAAPAIVNAVVLPLLFLSGIFIPIIDSSPEWIKIVGRIFPVKHFADAMRAGFLSDVMVRTPVGVQHAFPFDWWDVIFVALWGVAGLLLAVRYFSWEPRK